MTTYVETVTYIYDSGGAIPISTARCTRLGWLSYVSSFDFFHPSSWYTFSSMAVQR